MEGCLIFMHPCLHRMENILRLRIAVLIIYIFMMQKRIKKFSSGQLRFSPDGKYLYMVSELSCQIFVFEYQPDCKDMLRNVQVISTRREDGYDRENYTSALQMHPSGRYLLAGNRGHNSIVVYEVDKETGLLMLKGHTMLAGDFCREFCFVPDGSMLIVGIQHTDVVQTFFFDENKGILKWSGQEIVIPSPSCVIMGDSAK